MSTGTRWDGPSSSSSPSCSPLPSAPPLPPPPSSPPHPPSQGRFPANYYMEVENQGHLSCLDNNHTHFLLVDNGTHGHYSVEIELRCHLEKLISQKLLGNGGEGAAGKSLIHCQWLHIYFLWCVPVCVSFRVRSEHSSSVCCAGWWTRHSKCE